MRVGSKVETPLELNKKTLHSKILAGRFVGFRKNMYICG